MTPKSQTDFGYENGLPSVNSRRQAAYFWLDFEFIAYLLFALAVQVNASSMSTRLAATTHAPGARFA